MTTVTKSKKKPAPKASPKKAGPEEITQAMIDLWKQNNPFGVFKLNYEGRTGYITLPSRKIMQMATALSKGDSIALNEIVFKNIWLGGDDEILKNDYLFMGLIESDQVVDIMSLPQFTAEKL